MASGQHLHSAVHQKNAFPQKLLPLPWDNARKERKGSKPRRTMSGSRERLDIVTKRFGS